ncbi:MAG: 2OG-Fe(II) oxygenase [Bdellovibrionota bacterium]
MIVQDLIERGYSIQENFLSTAEVQLLSDEINTLFESGAFQSASIGNKTKTVHDHSIRSDKTYWLNSQLLTSAQQILFTALEKIRLECNEQMLLGLFDFEGHYSIFSKDSLYQKHFDSFKDSDLRVLSVVMYFNQDWKDGDGGELLLHSQIDLKVKPLAGTLVLFLSHDIEHEVLTSCITRRSFSGWFKKRPL